MRPRLAALAVLLAAVTASAPAAAARPPAAVGPGVVYETERTPLTALSLGRPAEALAARVADGDGGDPTWPPPPPAPRACASDAECRAACEGGGRGGALAESGRERAEEELLACANAFRARPAAFTDTLASACPAVVAAGDWPPGPPGTVRPPLGALASLTAAARAHGDDMAASRYFDHTPPTNASATPLAQVLATEPRASRVGQLIAAGWEAPVSVLAQLACTPANRRILLSCAYDAIGAGAAFPVVDAEKEEEGGWDSYYVLDLACVSPGGCPAECGTGGGGEGGGAPAPAVAAAVERAPVTPRPPPPARADLAAPPQTDYVWEKVAPEAATAPVTTAAAPTTPQPQPTTPAGADAPTPPPTTPAAAPPPPPTTTTTMTTPTTTTTTTTTAAAARPPPPPPPPTTTAAAAAAAATPAPTSPASALRRVGSGPPSRICTAGGVQLGARGPPLVIVDGGGDGRTTTVVVLTLPAGGRRPPAPADFEVAGSRGGTVTAVAPLTDPGQPGGEGAGRAYAVAVRLPSQRSSGGEDTPLPPSQPFTLSLARWAARDVVGAGPNTTALAPPPLTLGGVAARGVVAVTAGVL